LFKRCKIQGPILGPSLSVGLKAMTSFADYTNINRCNKILVNQKICIPKSLEAITKWSSKSSLKENESMSEICVFFGKDHLP
jgi:hypothetical protein